MQKISGSKFMVVNWIQEMNASTAEYVIKARRPSPVAKGRTVTKVGLEIGSFTELSRAMPALFFRKLTKPFCRSVSSSDDKLNMAVTTSTFGTGCCGR